MYPKVNHNIVIKLKNTDKSFRSIVADIGKKELLVGIPLDRKNIGLVEDGTELEIFFMSGDNQYKFSTRMMGKTKDKIPLYRLAKPQEQEIVKVQRRDNFRVRTNLRLIIKEKELVTIDLSVGGTLISSKLDFEIEEAEAISGTLIIPSKKDKNPEFIPFQGLVIRIELIEDLERKNIAIGFTEIDKRDQTKIIQYCFERQRQMRIIERESK